jgi:Fe-S-cluster-containing dehydrogenase component
MNARCPGQDSRKITAEMLICLQCQLEVEIFSDEAWVKCPKCGQIVHKGKMPSCVDWCPSAKQCLGEERWQNLKAGNGEDKQDACS